MGFDLIGWSESTPGTGTPGIAAGLGDRSYHTNLDTITLKQKANRILGAWYLAVSTPGYVRLSQPSFQVDLDLIQAALLGDADPVQAFSDFLENPIKTNLKDIEEQMTAYSNNATDEGTLIGLLMGDGAFGVPAIPDHIIRGYADQTLVANTWTMCAMTWTQTLPAGRYAIVGMKAGVYKSTGPGLALARLVLKESDWRPGVCAGLAEGDKIMRMSVQPHKYDHWHVMKSIELHTNQMPDVECLSQIADTDLVVELAVKYLGRS